MVCVENVRSVFAELDEAILVLSNEEYVMPCPKLSGATIGQHVRHIIEFFQCLEQGYHTTKVNYDERKRNPAIELNKDYAKSLLHEILCCLDKPNIGLHLIWNFEDEVIDIQTNYYRELLYNLEHTVHHMALVRIAIQELSDIMVAETFGVASSTTRYRNATQKKDKVAEKA